MSDMEQFLKTDSATKPEDLNTLQLQIKENKVQAHRKNCYEYVEVRTSTWFSIFCLICFDFQGVLDDIQTLQLNVSNVNVCFESIALKISDDVTRDKLQDDVTTLIDR